jgi:hypothetical protein
MVVAVGSVRVLDHKIAYLTEKLRLFFGRSQFPLVHPIEGTGAAAVISIVHHGFSIGY